MGVWEFVVVYLAAFVLVQLAIYRYLRDRSDGSTRVTFAGPPSADRGPGDDSESHGATERVEHHRVEDRRVEHLEPPTDPVERRQVDDELLRRCPNCGTANEPDGPYTFCRNCASRLPG